ncbi:MAG: hypothetical protein AAGC57_07670 [Pseudomonadota bacterium]
MKKTLLVLALLAQAGVAFAADQGPTRVADGFVPPPPKDGYSYPECFCTDTLGNRVELGQIACLQIGQRQVTSRCEKASNLVIWRHQTEGCSPGV